jgi:hypothetical protein
MNGEEQECRGRYLFGAGQSEEAGLGRRNYATTDERRSEGRPKILTYGWMGRIRNQFSLFK